ncbi:efflux RND transporter periplasmic adaptor subunit [Vibrio maerlii]|uniref:efflux RND transporter periplasmic adaptor subunit n=1 Tax=Vibrio maerlii TaxID=2231648 RepID=UPI000E3D2D94|nr:efflux RND transporter periplasmic adaptor subunit [Vibrio maerlii]
MNRKLLLATTIGAILITGCSEPSGQKAQAPSPNVVTQDVSVIPLQSSRAYIGRIEAVEDASITAQVSGYILSRNFTEGQIVQKGELLYTIDPAPFEALVANAKAAVAQANAALKKAQLDFERAQDLLPRGSISKSEYDALNAALLGAEAQLEASRAQLNSSEVSLSHTKIVAPFKGRVGESQASIGDLVSPNSGILTTLVSLDPIHTSFSMSERERLNFGMDKMEGDGSSESNSVEVHVKLENDEYFEHLGQLDFIDNRINTNTGTISLRAIVDNPDYRLLPGQHISVELREKQANDVNVIPRRAVQTDLEGHFVMVVREGNIAERVNVTLGAQTEQGIVIKTGLQPEDVVITQGLQRVRNGVTVKVSEHVDVGTSAEQ